MYGSRRNRTGLLGKKFGLVVLMAATVFAVPAAADDLAPCKTTAGADSCSPVFACFEKDGGFFKGRAIGRGGGTVAGELDNGEVCTGKWSQKGLFGLPSAVVTCPKRGSAVVFFTYQDSYTGTATGKGRIDDDDAVTMMSGHNVPEYLMRTTGNEKFFCGGREVPIG